MSGNPIANPSDSWNEHYYCDVCGMCQTCNKCKCDPKKLQKWNQRDVRPKGVE